MNWNYWNPDTGSCVPNQTFGNITISQTCVRWSFCPKCGKKLESDWNNCPGCGVVIGTVGFGGWYQQPMITWTVGNTGESAGEVKG